MAAVFRVQVVWKTRTTSRALSCYFEQNGTKCVFGYVSVGLILGCTLEDTSSHRPNPLYSMHLPVCNRVTKGAVNSNPYYAFELQASWINIVPPLQFNCLKVPQKAGKIGR